MNDSLSQLYEVQVKYGYRSALLEASYRIDELVEALEDLIVATTNIRGINEDMKNIYCSVEFKNAHNVIYKYKGEEE